MWAFLLLAYGSMFPWKLWCSPGNVLRAVDVCFSNLHSSARSQACHCCLLPEAPDANSGDDFLVLPPGGQQGESTVFMLVYNELPLTPEALVALPLCF